MFDRPVSGMVMAAGLGTRLRPLTHHVPKPLLPVLGQPLIAHSFAILRAAGFRDVVVNTHHLAAKMKAELATGAQWDMRIHWSDESSFAEPLGSGGGLRHARSLLADGPIVVLNGDSLIDLDLAGVLASHEAAAALDDTLLATLVLKPRYAGEPYTPIISGTSPLGFKTVDRFAFDRLDPAWAEQGLLFSGAYILEPRVLDYLPTDKTAPCIIRDGLVPGMAAGGWINAFAVEHGLWADLGTPRSYIGAVAARADPLSGSAYGQFDSPQRGVTLARRAIINDASFLAPVVVEPGASIELGTVLGPDVLVGPGVRIGKKVRLQNAIIEAGAVIPDGFEAADVILLKGDNGSLEIHELVEPK
jgi:NDP-sugar pyrophosphorylase family protein